MSRVAPTLLAYFAEDYDTGMVSPVIAAQDIRAMRAELRALLAVAKAANGSWARGCICKEPLCVAMRRLDRLADGGR